MKIFEVVDEAMGGFVVGVRYMVGFVRHYFQPGCFPYKAVFITCYACGGHLFFFRYHILVIFGGSHVDVSIGGARG